MNTRAEAHPGASIDSAIVPPRAGKWLTRAGGNGSSARGADQPPPAGGQRAARAWRWIVSLAVSGNY
jgi:hypothetical protein